MSSLLCDANTFFELNKGRMEKTSAEHNIEHRYDRDERQRRKEAESAINPEQKVTVKVPSFMKNI
jgi:predicted SAM-dependent methyltransferase